MPTMLLKPLEKGVKFETQSQNTEWNMQSNKT